MKLYYYNCQIKQQRINALIIHSRDDILYRHWSVKGLFDIKTELNTITEKASRKFCIENPVFLNCKTWIP